MTTPKAIEKPMLFSAPMVRAILDGRKSQTRRVVKPQPPLRFNSGDVAVISNGTEFAWSRIDGNTKEAFPPDPKPGIHPPHPVGSRIWVRETWRNHSDNIIVYAADKCTREGMVCKDPFDVKWSPSIHMPRWASRITLEVTDVRVQRLQEITKQDVIAEGIEGLEDVHAGWHQPFAQLWESIHGPGAWEQNPWVWAYTFRSVTLTPDPESEKSE